MRLPLARRLDALEHCIHSLVGSERNSLKLHARVRRAQAALGLKGVLRSQEVGQLILEAHDQRHGNSFQALGSSQRLAMRLPVLAWDIPNCLPSQDLTILGGRAKVGKTRLAHALLSCLLCAEDFLGFGAPERPRPVILISDDQADGDTAAMLQESGMWEHPLLIWSRRFQASEANLDGLRRCLSGQSGAVVMLDSLRSITRSCSFGENDPEMGTLIYDLRHQITEVGGTALSDANGEVFHFLRDQGFLIKVPATWRELYARGRKLQSAGVSAAAVPARLGLCEQRWEEIVAAYEVGVYLYT